MLNTTIIGVLMSGLTLATTEQPAHPGSLSPTQAINVSADLHSRYETRISSAQMSARVGTAGVTPEMSVNGITPYDLPPEGAEIHNYYRSGESYYLNMFGQLTFAEVDGEMSSVVITDKEVWIYNPFAKGPSRTWLKGDLDAQGTVAVKTPVCVSISHDQSGKEVPMYIINIKQKIVEENGEKYAIYVEDTENSTIRYKWNATTETLELEEGQLGMCFWKPDTDKDASEEWVWYGIADLKQKFQPCPYTPQTPPADLSWEDYTIVSYDYNTSAKQGDIVQVGFDSDNNVWIKNLHKILTDFYVKGEKTDKGYVFKTQYLGAVDQVATHAFLLPGFYTMEDGIKAVGSLDEMTMMFDQEKKTLRSESDTLSWFINCGKGEIRFLQCNENPTLMPYMEKESIMLTDPVIEQFDAADVENKIAGCLTFNINAFDQDGDFVDTRKLFYNIMLDGEPMVFDPNVYLDFMNPVIDMPFNTSNYDISNFGITRMVYLYRNDFNKIGVRLSYIDGNRRIDSNVVEVVNHSGVQSVGTVDKEVSSEFYTDLAGRRVTNPDKGVYVKTIIYTDGSRKSDKIMILN